MQPVTGIVFLCLGYNTAVCVCVCAGSVLFVHQDAYMQPRKKINKKKAAETSGQFQVYFLSNYHHQNKTTDLSPTAISSLLRFPWQRNLTDNVSPTVGAVRILTDFKHLILTNTTK